MGIVLCGWWIGKLKQKNKDDRVCDEADNIQNNTSKLRKYCSNPNFQEELEELEKRAKRVKDIIRDRADAASGDGLQVNSEQVKRIEQVLSDTVKELSRLDLPLESSM